MEDEIKTKLVTYAIYVLCGGITLGLIAGCAVNMALEIVFVLLYIVCFAACNDMGESPISLQGVFIGAGMIACIALYIYLTKRKAELKRQLMDEEVIPEQELKKAKVWMIIGAIVLGVIAFFISWKLIQMFYNTRLW